MSRYGLATYGVSFYGPDTGIGVDFSSYPFSALPIVGNAPSDLIYVYATLQLEWSLPHGNWTKLRLLRNSTSYSVDENDGVLLIDVDNSAAPNEFLDTTVAGGKFYYYTIWVFDADNSSWLRSAEVAGLPIKDYGYERLLLERLPGVYTTDATMQIAGAPDMTGDLAKFLGLFGRELNYIRTTLDTLLAVRTPMAVSGLLLPQLANNFGLCYEPLLGDRINRTLLANIVHLYKIKGTRDGLEGTVSAYTGWDSQLLFSKNRMLDYNDSSFEESLGRWHAVSGGTLARITTGTESVNAWSTATGGGLGTNMQSALARMTMSAATGSIKLGDDDPVTHGVPVHAGDALHLSCASTTTGGAGRSQQLSVDFYDQHGVYLSSVSGSSGSIHNGTGLTAVTTVNATAPANSAYVGVTHAFTSMTSGDKVYVDYYLLVNDTELTDPARYEPGYAAVAAGEEAREYPIRLFADRVNLADRPNWEAGDVTGSGHWDTTSNGALAVIGTDHFIGTHCGQVTSTAGGNTTVRYSALHSFSSGSPLRADSQTVSVWCKSAHAGRLAHLVVEDLSSGTPVATHTGTSVALTTTGWTQLSVTVPSQVGDAARLTVVFEGCAASEVNKIGGMLQELGLVARSYFDAGPFAAATGHSDDYIWSGTAQQSESHYYSNRDAKDSRLRALLPRYIWLGHTYTLRYGVALA